jgi:hypothetical protein
MGSVDRYIVLDVLATYLFLILMSSSNEKFYICLLGRYVSLLLGGDDPWRQHQTPAGAILPGSPSLKEWQKSTRLLSTAAGRPRPAGANFPQFTLLLGGGRHTGEAYVF